ncbi:MAG TPA: M61 family peptidase, partial [Thermoanaerobaculia bacterium]
SGPLTDVVNLKITANGAPVEWRRDPFDMFVILLDAPAKTTALEVDLSYLSPIAGGNFTAGPNSTANLAVLSWNTLLLFPPGKDASEIFVEGTIRVPDGWRVASALDHDDAGKFQRATLATYVDSPVILGRYFKTVALPAVPNAPVHRINIVSESNGDLEAPATFAADYARLVAEAGAAFGSYHFSKYDWLLTLSDDVAHFGLEHHESSDNRMPEATLSEDVLRRGLGSLLSHEYAHSWNGKFRRPAAMLSPDYQKPMDGSLLWVYEGLTQYMGLLLATRSGLWSQEYYRENLANVAAGFDIQPGRTWRPLADTATAAQLLFPSADAWRSLRRGTDFYDESILLWLEVDSIIRAKTDGRASLDDFTRRFHGGPGGKPEVKPYTFDDIVANLNAVAPYDWRTHLTTRITSLSPRAPMAGVTANGWKLVFNDTPNEAVAGSEKRNKLVDVSHSLGLTIREDGTIRDAILGRPAANAGIGPGMKIVAVNGRGYTRAVLEAALKEKGTMDLLMENNNFFRTHSVDYHDGLRYPHLVRDESVKDGLATVLAAKAK